MHEKHHRLFTDCSPITPKIQKIAVSPLIFSIHWKMIDWLWGRPPCLERKKWLTHNAFPRVQNLGARRCGTAFWVTNESCQDLIRDYFFLTRSYTCPISPIRPCNGPKNSDHWQLHHSQLEKQDSETKKIQKPVLRTEQLGSKSNDKLRFITFSRAGNSFATP